MTTVDHPTLTPITELWSNIDYMFDMGMTVAKIAQMFERVQWGHLLFEHVGRAGPDVGYGQ